jgi:tetratricopeptide (TPR) repeat protein
VNGGAKLDTHGQGGVKLEDPMLARALAIAAILLAASSARADETSAAKEIYERGVRYYNLGQFEDALDAFRSIYSIDRPQLLFNIAQCQRQLKQYEAAARSYHAFLASSPGSDDAATAARMAQEMDARTTAAQLPPAATNPAPAGPRAPAPAPADRRRPLRLAGIAAGGVGLGLVAAGIAFAVVSGQAGEQAWHGAAYDYDADQRRGGFRSGAIASFVIGGVAVAAGSTLWILGRRR